MHSDTRSQTGRDLTARPAPTKAGANAEATATTEATAMATATANADPSPLKGVRDDRLRAGRTFFVKPSADCGVFWDSYWGQPDVAIIFFAAARGTSDTALPRRMKPVCSTKLKTFRTLK